MKFVLFSLVLAFNAFAAEFDHSHVKWSKILKEHTKKEVNQVSFNYDKLKKAPKELKSYLKDLEAVKKDQFKSFTRDQKLAFWINAYNAYTIKIIIDNYPVKSIFEIKSNFFTKGPWKKDFINLLGKEMSLDDIEHGTIRKQFKEPRIHFAVNCASIGCPSLLQEAFVANKLESQFQSASDNFLNNKLKNFVKGNTLHLSKIFKWYGDDFKQYKGAHDKGFVNYIVKELKLEGKYTYTIEDYDWKLNKI